ncbi:MAG: NADH-quinone oxidoreductase subunit C [Arcobacteraceae bacterium]|nr:NADH-quinone oxidoreductase subunit C [Arcobacteraceae bacterium]
MINRIPTSLPTVVANIKAFYDKKIWHFLTLNGVKLDSETTEIQWIFSKYGAINEVTMFYTSVKQDEIIPSIVEVLPSAIISQREIVDMFGITVENSEKGLYLDEDSEQMPLSSCGI